MGCIIYKFILLGGSVQNRCFSKRFQWYRASTFHINFRIAYSGQSLLLVDLLIFPSVDRVGVGLR
jgi:hypothetical protein